MVAVIVNRDNDNFLSVHKLNCTTSVNKCKFNSLVTLVYRTPKYSTMQRQVFTRQRLNPQLCNHLYMQLKL